MATHGTVLLTGEKESRSATVKEDTVTSHHVTQHKAGKQVVMDWSFDFTGIDRDTLLKLATRGLLIDQRTAWKKLGEKEALKESQTKQEFIVMDILSSKKRGKTDVEKLAALNLSKEQILAYLEG